MSPKQIIQCEFDRSITPWLEGIGFAYSRSQFKYQRKAGDFVQSISVMFSQRNSSAYATFWSSFDVHSNHYRRWYEKQGRMNCNSRVGGAMDWNVTGWQAHPGESMAFHFTDPAQVPNIVSEWRKKCETAELHYLAKLSSWEGAAEDLLKCKMDHERAADLFLIAGLPQRACDSLKEGMDCLNQHQFEWADKSHPTLVRKKKRLMEERDAQYRLLEERLKSIIEK